MLIDISNLFAIAFVPLVICILILLICKVPMKKICVVGGVYIYITVVLGLTLCPIPIRCDDAYMDGPDNFIPFATIIDCIRTAGTETVLMNIGGNVAMLIPAGVFLCLQKRRPRIVALCIVLFPTAVEVVQLLVCMATGVHYRSFDVDDILLGMIGCTAGYFLTAVVAKRWQKEKRQETK